MSNFTDLRRVLHELDELGVTYSFVVSAIDGIIELDLEADRAGYSASVLLNKDGTYTVRDVESPRFPDHVVRRFIDHYRLHSSVEDARTLMEEIEAGTVSLEL